MGLSLYSRHIGDRLTGLSGVYVDDMLQTGDEELDEKRTEKLAKGLIQVPANTDLQICWYGIFTK